MTTFWQSRLRVSGLAAAAAVGALLSAASTANAQAVVGNETNAFPGVNLLYTLTWGADDGAACTTVGGPTDNGYNSKLILNSNCVAAKFLYYENGWADIYVWNRNAAGSNRGIAGFGIFWCHDGAPVTDAFRCPDGANPVIGGALPPHSYNDKGSAADPSGALGNWYDSPTGNDPIDFRIMYDPNGDGVNDASEILVDNAATSDGYTTNILTNGCCGLKGDGWGDNLGLRYLNSQTPFTSLAGNGALRFQFYMGVGAAYNFSTQWMVLDVQFTVATGGPPNSDDYWSCIDDRYTGTPTNGPDQGPTAPPNTNIGCGGLAAPVEVTPEPATLALLATGLVGLALVGYRRRKV